jgi:hypothetical protein
MTALRATRQQFQTRLSCPFLSEKTSANYIESGVATSFLHLLRLSNEYGMNGMLRTVAALWMLGLAASGFSQSIPDAAHPTAACGNDKITFEVSLGQVGDTAAADTGKATVYFVELYNLMDKGRINRPTIRQGVDGKWLGATQGFTYLSAPIDPGPHHLCSKWQSHFGRLSDQVSLNDFDAEAGKRYESVTELDIVGCIRLHSSLIEASRALLRSAFPESERQICGSEDVRHPFEVIGHHGKAQLGTSTRLPAKQKTWMTEDAVLNRCEGMLHDGSS